MQPASSAPAPPSTLQDSHALSYACKSPSLLDPGSRLTEPSHVCTSQVDLLYLHNAAEMQIPAVGRTVFMERLKAAFAYLEGGIVPRCLRQLSLVTGNSDDLVLFRWVYYQDPAADCADDTYAHMCYHMTHALPPNYSQELTSE